MKAWPARLPACKQSDPLHAGSSRGLGSDRAGMIFRGQTAIQIPPAALMVFYTHFRLWLLSTQQIG